jgi:hypothetical protein
MIEGTEDWQKPTLQVLAADDAEFNGVNGVDAPGGSNFS